MAPKKTNIKIKRSKFNLYNKKKSKARRVFKIILSVVVVCGLGVLGYGLGKPLLKYFRERGQNVSTLESDASALLSSIMNAGSTDNTGGTASADGSSGGSGTGQQPPAPQSGEKVCYLPDNAAADMSTLSAALSAAKNSGCSVVAVTLKDTAGFLYYKTSYAGVKDTAAVKGSLSAQQIAAEISKAGFTPAARINTLMDRTSSVFAGANYQLGDPDGMGTWLDNRADNGGKPWMSPFRPQAAAYIEHIAGELSGAGFKRVICVNTRYPAFHGSDISTYLSKLPLSDSAKRVEALWNIVDAAKKGADKSGAELWLEISGTSLAADAHSGTDAELAADKTKLRNVNIVVNYDIVEPSVSSSTGSATSTTAAATPAGSAASGSAGSNASRSAHQSDYQTAKMFISKAQSALGGAAFSVRLPQTLTGKALEDVTRAFTEAGVPVC